MLPRLAATFTLTLLLSTTAVRTLWAQGPASSEQEAVSPAHVALVDGVASLEREGRSESPLNMPLLSGDRLKTADGRVEVQFADGSTLHLDRSTTIDVQSDDLIRLIDGRVRLNIPGASRTIAYRIDSASGSVRIRDAGEYRVSVLHGTDENQLELAVLRGSADIFTEQGTTGVRAGERAYASAGLAPSYAYAYNSANWDAFDRWSEQRRDTRLGVSTQYLPSDMQQYASTFDQDGDWRYAQPYGYVWYPRVAASWRPYYYGRWAAYPRYGWTWVSVDHFGWPTHHYGRWGFSSGAWFWVPGNHWGPAWVSWGYAGNYVSWCPLGYNNLPLISINVFNYGPHYRYAGYQYYPAWTVVSRSHFGHGWVHDGAVNWWDGNGHGRGSFASAAAVPINPNVAVPRGSVPVHWAGTRSLPPEGGSHVAVDRSASAAAAARNRWVPPSGGSRATRAASGADGEKAGAPPRDVAVPRTGAPRYVNRGDQIVRSQTERPSAPAPSEAGISRRVEGPAGRAAAERTIAGEAIGRTLAGAPSNPAIDRNSVATRVPSEAGVTRRADGSVPSDVTRRSGLDAAVPRYSVGARTMPAGPARRADEPAPIDRGPQDRQRAVAPGDFGVSRRVGGPVPSEPGVSRRVGGPVPSEAGVSRRVEGTPESRVPDAGGMAVPRAREYGPVGGAPGRAPLGIERGGPSPSRPSGPGASPAPSRGGGGGSVAVPRSQPSGDGAAAPRRGGRGGA